MNDIRIASIDPIGRATDAADQAYVVKTTAGSVTVTPDSILTGVWAVGDYETLAHLPLEADPADYERTIWADTPEAAAEAYLFTKMAFA